MPDFLSQSWNAVHIAFTVFGVMAGGILGRVLASLSRRRLTRGGLILGGACAGGLAIWFGFGHFGFGPGGPGQGGGGQPNAAQKSDATPPASTADNKHSSRPDVLHVRMLGGTEVKDNRIYVLDGQACNWDELKAKLAEQQGQNPAFRSVEIDFQPDSVDQDNPAVQRLKDWATQHRLDVRTFVPAGSATVSH